MYQGNRIVSRAFRDRVIQRYPFLVSDPQCFALFEFLAFATETDVNGNKLIPHVVLKQVAGVPSNASSRRFKSGELLEQYEAYFPLFRWSQYHYQSKTARSALHDGLTPAMQKSLDRELATFHQTPATDRVHFLTGERAASTSTTDLRDAHEREARRYRPALAAPCRLVDYFNDLPVNSFTSIVSENIDSAVQVALALKPRQRRLELCKLHAIQRQPKPFYGASRAGKTARISPHHQTIHLLKRDVKYALIDGWVTFDLKNAHLAIISKDWRIPEVAKWLSKPSNDAWARLASLFPGMTLGSLKPALKEAVYAACFGRQVRRLVEALSDRLGVSFATAKQIFNDDLLVKVFAHRSYWAAHYAKKGRANDCFGRTFSCPTKRAATKVLPLLAQSTEMKLLLPALDLARKRPNDLRIMLWEHDGFSVQFRRDEKRNEGTKRALVRAINRHCQKLGYPTRLEEKNS